MFVFCFQSLVLLSRTLPPKGNPVKLASLVYSRFSSLAQGPALLTSAVEGQLCLFKLVDATVSYLEPVARNPATCLLFWFPL